MRLPPIDRSVTTGEEVAVVAEGLVLRATAVVDRAWNDVILPTAHALLGAAATAAEHADA